MLGLLLSVISMLFFIKEMIRTGEVAVVYILGCVAIAIVLGYNWYQSRIPNKKIRYNKALFFAALVWMKVPSYQWVCVVFIVLAILESQAKYDTEVGFSEDEIVINTLIKRRFAWTQLNNVVLKDGILTLDFTNNKIMQRETLEDGEDDADEDEFNKYCEQQLKAAHYRVRTGTGK